LMEHLVPEAGQRFNAQSGMLAMTQIT
jgi:hypothetical protein